MGSLAASPAPGLLAALRPRLALHLPFARMEPAEVDAFIAQSVLRYYADGAEVLGPGHGEVREILLVRDGAVARLPPPAEGGGAATRFEAGDLLPIGAALARRPVTASYRAVGDTFLLALPVDAFDALRRSSHELEQFVHARTLSMLEASRRSRLVDHAAQVLREQSLELPLAQVMRGPAVCCPPGAPLIDALGQMHARRIGSIVVTDAQGRAEGILTRHDVLGRVTLANKPLDAPIGDVMVAPVYTLPETSTALDATLLMARRGVRHVPVTREGAVVGVVSERDLFALQRHSLAGVTAAVHGARDVAALGTAAAAIRSLTQALFAQGVGARQLTSLVSQLNDALTQKLLALLAPLHGIDLRTLCWVALGSEGRGEQTIATDQDNALVLPDGLGATARDRALAFGRAVNAALDACGYPLCKGGIMAGEPGCCLTVSEWRARFMGWIDRGVPQDLLDACTFFDLRPLAGDAQLATGLMEEVRQAAGRTPRFLRLMALNALTREPPLNWLGALRADAAGAIDLKLQGTAIYVDAARIYALARGVASCSTAERLRSAGAALGVPAAEYEGWVTGFEFLQMLRLRVQLEPGLGGGGPNSVVVDRLNDIDGRMLRESLATVRRLQQRLGLDYDR